MLTVTKYQIRAGGPQPVAPGCPSSMPTRYVYQTFGAWKVDTDIEEATTTLKKSTDLQGQKFSQDVEDPIYIANTYSSISYSGRPLRTTDGIQIFTEQAAHVELWTEESECPGWG